MGRFIDFLIGALCCYIAILLCLDFSAQMSPAKQVVTFYKSEQECNKDSGLDCESMLVQLYVVSK